MRESIIYILSLFLLFLLPTEKDCYKKLETVFFSPICFGGSASIEGNVDESAASNVTYSWLCTDGQASTDEDFIYMDMTGVDQTCTLIVTHGDPFNPCTVEQDIVIEVNPEVNIDVTNYNGPYCETEAFTLDVDCDFLISSSHGTPNPVTSTIEFVPGDLLPGVTQVEVICTAPGPCESEPFLIDIEICEKPDFNPTCRDFKGGLP